MVVVVVVVVVVAITVAVAVVVVVVAVVVAVVVVFVLIITTFTKSTLRTSFIVSGFRSMIKCASCEQLGLGCKASLFRAPGLGLRSNLLSGLGVEAQKKRGLRVPSLGFGAAGPKTQVCNL